MTADNWVKLLQVTGATLVSKGFARVRILDRS